MFWGLIMEPGRCYTQTVKNAFHVSMAALDVSNSSDEHSQVMCVFDNRNYLLCTLSKKGLLQCPLDLNFDVGTKVSFAINGKSHVHLSGYLTPDDIDDFEALGEEEEDDEEVDVEVLKAQEALTKKQLKRAQKTIPGPPEKKVKKENSISANSTDNGEEEESSDSDFDVNKMLEEPESDDLEDSDEEQEEEDDDEDAEEEEDEDLEDEVSSLSDGEEETPVVKQKQNGVAKKTPVKQTNAKVAEKTPTLNQKQQKKDDKKQPTSAQKTTPKSGTPKAKKQVLKGGVMIEDIQEGSGDVAQPGKLLHVYYEGRLKDNNKVFDSTLKGSGFAFKLGKGDVIKGWDTGVAGMRVGGKRRITCPPTAAYGSKGSPPTIPANSTLVFEVQLKKVS